MTDWTLSINGPARVRPAMTGDAAFWWEGLEGRELRIQRCAACSVLRHPPQPRCRGCGSLAWDFVVAGGEGSLHSFVVYHYPALEGTRYPYTVALVDLDEGIRVVAPLAAPAGRSPSIGERVRLDWATADGGGGWPCFRPAGP